ncbi:MAG TPA: DUF3073 domain-containing protein [Actinomycetes bacterium]|nr:DUF3073 domain-containing protein [Actinomycetes bacterium]
MGRGRAKAKQTKVARQLKYSTGDLDVSRLSEELGASSPAVDNRPSDYDDPYADQAPVDEDTSRN